MKSDKQLFEEYCIPAYEKMYREAEPSLDFQQVLDNPDDFEDDWYMDYYLDQERQDEIIEETIKDLSKLEAKKVKNELYLGCAPRGVKDE